MKQALPLTFVFLMSISHHIDAVELLVLPGDRHVSGMSHDGSRLVVTQIRLHNALSDYWFFVTTRDDPTNLKQLEASPGDVGFPGDSPRHRGMSSSGEYIAGHFDTLPARWNIEGEVELLPLPNGLEGARATDISSDDNVVVGYGYDDLAYRWAIGGDVASLSPLPDFDESFAVGVSADGRVAVGVSRIIDDRGRTLSEEGTMWIYRDPDDIQIISLGPDSTAYAASRDGAVVTGYTLTDDWSSRTAFLWSADEGNVSLGRLPAQASPPVAISLDGKLVVGHSGSDPSWVWDEVHGMRNLETVLIEEHGVDPSVFGPINGNFSLQAMSGDTTAIGGRFLDGQSTNVAIYLDRPLVVTSGVTGDFNGNAELDVADLDLLTAELQTDRNVDLFDVNGDGDVGTADRTFWVTDLSQTYFGDANLDGTVDFSDFLSLSAHFGEEAGWANGDFDGNGQTDFPDFLLLSENFGMSSANASTASVPEPSSCLLLTIGLLAFCRKLLRRQIGRDMVQGVI